MLPSGARPARSRSLGSKANTEGGKPRVVGGSPAASPISRCASASRVSESITNSTSRPRSRKYSAIAVAQWAACTRTSAGSSLVATTTTLLASRRAEIALDELVDLAAAFADQGDHVHVGRRVARHHAQRHALAHARAGEDAHPLPLAAGQQAVDGADAGRQRLDDPRPLDRGQGRPLERHPVGQRRAWATVDGAALGVDDAAQ